jgi:two-component system OmpR family response regulator
MNKLIALVEDDVDQRRNYAAAISRKGYRIAEYANRVQALAGINRQQPDLAVLDIVLQDEVDGGFQLCRELLARHPELPLIFLTHRVDEIDKISGLRLGAWDYLPKPIGLDYLAERISSLLRLVEYRQSEQHDACGRRVGQLTLYQQAMLVQWQQQRVDLTVTEFRLLAHLLRQPGHAVSYESLMGATRQQYVTSNTINTHMRNIRRKFLLLDAEFDHIKNEYGFGYRWSNPA